MLVAVSILRYLNAQHRAVGQSMSIVNTLISSIMFTIGVLCLLMLNATQNRRLP
jgi:hypothetical protein